MADKYFSFDEMLNGLRGQNSDFLTSEHLKTVIKNGPFVGDTKRQNMAIEAVEKAQKAGMTMETLLGGLHDNVRALGYDLVFSESAKRDGTYVASLVPASGATVSVNYRGKTHDVSLSAAELLKTTSGKLQQAGLIAAALQQMPHFAISGANKNSGLIKVHGQEAIDALMFTDINNEIALITRQIGMIKALKDKLDPNGNSYLTQYLRMGTDPTKSTEQRKWAQKNAKGSIESVRREYMSGEVVTKNFQHSSMSKRIAEEVLATQQGTGTIKGRTVRQGYISAQNYINKIVAEDRATIERYARNQKMGLDRAQDKLADTYMRMLSLYAGTQEAALVDKQIEDLISNGLGGFKGLWNNSASLQKLRALGQWIHLMGADPSLSAEGSIGAKYLSFMHASDFGAAGSLRSIGDRKPLQGMGSLSRSRAGIEALQELEKKQKIRNKTVLTALESQYKRDMDKTGENSLYRGLYASAEEIRTAGETVRQNLVKTNEWKKFVAHWGSEQQALSALGLGGTDLWEGAMGLSEEVLGSLGSKQGRSLSVTLDEWNQYKKRVKEQNRRKQHPKKLSSRELNRLAALEAIRDQKGLSPDEIFSTGLQIGSSDEGKTIAFLAKKPVATGSKLVGSAIKETVGGVFSQLLLNQLAQNRGLANGDSFSFVSHYKKSDVRSFGEQIGGYLDDVLSRATEDQLNKLGETEFFKGWVTKQGDHYQINRDLFAGYYQNPEQTLKDFWRDLVSVFPAQKGLFTIRNGKIAINQQKLTKATTLGQADLYTYGQPGFGRTPVRADYRSRGSADRTLAWLKGGRALLKDEDARFLSQLLLGDTYRDEQGQPQLTMGSNGPKSSGVLFGDTVAINNYVRYQKMRQAVREAEAWSLGDKKSKKPAQTLTLEQILDPNSASSMLILGGATPDKFVSSIFTQEEIDQYKQGHNNSLSGLPDGAYLNAADLALHADSLEYVNGAITEESWKNSLWGQIAAAMKGGRKVYVAAPFAETDETGKSVVGNRFYQLPTLDPEEFVSGNGYKIPELLRGWGAFFADVVKTQQMPQQQKYINLNQSALDAINQTLLDVEGKGGSAFQLQKGSIARSMYGAASPASYEQALGDDPEARRRALTMVGMGQDAGLGLLKQYGYEQLVNAYHYMNDELYTAKGVDKQLADLEGKFEKITDQSKKELAIKKALTNKILAQLTVGSKAYQERLDAASKTGKKVRGLPTLNERFPLSHGFDSYFAEAYIDAALNGKGLSTNRVLRPGFGIQSGYNADFDGDMLALIDLLGATGKLGDGNLESIRNLIDASEQIHSLSGVLAARSVRSSMSDDLGTPGQYKAMISELAGNIEAQEIAGQLSRLNKDYTGRFSNYFQAVNEMVYKTAPSATQKGHLSDKGQDQAIDDLLTTLMFEMVTQDAISSKKIIKRIAQQYAAQHLGSVGWRARFFEDLDQLSALLSSPDVFSSKSGLDALGKQMQKMGIIGSNDNVFSGRITNDAYARIVYALNGDQEKLASLLGVSSNKVPLFELDASGNYDPKKMYIVEGGQKRYVSSDEEAGSLLGGISFSWDRLTQAILSTQDYHKVNLGDVIRNRKKYVPGLLYTSKLRERGLTTPLENADALITSALGSSGSANRPTTRSVNSLLDQIFGDHFTDTTEFTSKLLEAYAGAPRPDEFRGDEALEMDAAIYRRAQEDNWRPFRGRIADATEQALVKANKMFAELGSLDFSGRSKANNEARLGLMGTNTSINNVADLERFVVGLRELVGDGKKRNTTIARWAAPKLAALEKLLFSPYVSTDGKTELSEGLGFLLGGGFGAPDNPDALQKMYQAWGYTEEQAAEFVQDMITKGQLPGALFGGPRKGSLQTLDALRLGELFNETVMEAAGGNLANVGASEVNLFGSNKNGQATYRGRADRLVFNKNTNTVTVLDKKVTGAVSPRQLLQTYAYVRALRQLQESLIPRKDQFAGSSASEIWDMLVGSSPSLVGGLGITDATEGGQLAQMLMSGAKIETAIAGVDPKKGLAAIYRLGDSLTGDRTTDDRIMEYFEKGTPIEQWEQGIRDTFYNRAQAILDPSTAKTATLPSEIVNYAKHKADLLAAYREIDEKTEKLNNDPTLSWEEKAKLQESIDKIQSDVVDKYEQETKAVAAYWNNDKTAAARSEYKDTARKIIKDTDEEFKKQRATDWGATVYRQTIKAIDQKAQALAAGDEVYFNELRAQKEHEQLLEAEKQETNRAKKVLLGGQIQQADLASRKATEERKLFEWLRGGGDKDAQERAQAKMQLLQQEAASTQAASQPGLIGGIEQRALGYLRYMFSGMGVARIIARVMQGIKKVTQEAKALDQALTNLRIVTGDTKVSTTNLLGEYANLAKQLGVTTKEVASSAVGWLRQGYSLAESMDLVKSSMYLSTLGMMDSAAATKSLTTNNY